MIKVCCKGRQPLLSSAVCNGVVGRNHVYCSHFNCISHSHGVKAVSIPILRSWFLDVRRGSIVSALLLSPQPIHTNKVIIAIITKKFSRVENLNVTVTSLFLFICNIYNIVCRFFIIFQSFGEFFAHII